MKRGRCSDREHLNAIQFKTEQESAKIQKLQKEAESMETTKALKSVVFKASERIKDLVGVSVNDKEKVALMKEKGALATKLEKTIDDNRLLSENLIRERREFKLCKSELDKAIEVNKSLRNYITAVKKELKSFGTVFSEEQKQAIKISFPNVHKAMDAGPTKKQQSQNKGRGMGI